MSDYMAEIKRVSGYESLKSLYMQQYPTLQGENKSHMDERVSGGDDEDEDELVPSNPIERRDARIAELEKTSQEVSSLKENMTKLKAELHLAKKSSHVAQKKLKFVKTVTEDRLKECLPEAGFRDNHSSVLITLMSTLIDDDSLEMDPETETMKPKVDLLKAVEDSFENGTDDAIKEKLEFVRNKVLEKVIASAVKPRARISSTSSSVGSQDSKKRKSSTDLKSESLKIRAAALSSNS